MSAPSIPPFLPATANEEDQTAHLRPTLYIGLGGFGCSVLRLLKRQLQELAPNDLDGFAFLGLDTHRQGAVDELSAGEYLPLSPGVVPDEVARNHPRILGWYRDIVGAFRARSIVGGADQNKPVGRLAFRQPAALADFVSRLELAHDRLARYRERFQVGKPPKVYVVSTLAGGTGAGCLIDVMAVTGRYFTQNVDADFPFQAVLVTPDVLVGEVTSGTLPLLYTNTYATLVELNHFLSTSEIVRYDNGAMQHLKVSREVLPNPIHLIGDRNDEGTAVATRIEDLAEIVVSYLASEVATPLESTGAGPRIHDRENPYSLELDQAEMAYRCFSSFGVVRCGFPARELGRFFAAELIDRALGVQLARPATANTGAAQWLDARRLREAGTDQLQDLLREGNDPDALRVALDARGELLGRSLPYGKLATEAEGLAREWRKRLQERQGQLLQQRAAAALDRLTGELEAELTAQARGAGIGAAISWGDALETDLKAPRSALKAEQVASQKALSLANEQVEDSLQGIASAVEGWLGRKRRVADALSDFGHRLEGQLTQQIDLWVKEGGATVYAGLLDTLRKARVRWGQVEELVQSRRQAAQRESALLRVQLDQLADVARRGRGNQFSLVDSRGASRLAGSLFDADAAALARSLSERWWASGRLSDPSVRAETWLEMEIKDCLDHEVGPRFEKLDLLALMDDFVPGDAERRTLFQQLGRLSSPLFNVDPNRRQSSYDDFWIVAIHPDLERGFDDTYRNLLPGKGITYARLDSRFEIVLYQLRYGFTLQSLRRLPGYENHYERQLRVYLDNHPRKPVKPVHGWPGAESWDRLLPRPEEEAAIKWFALGRAFNFLHPTAGKKPEAAQNRAFLSVRGSLYSVEVNEDEETELGRGLTNALRAFSERPDLQEGLRNRIEAKVLEVGAETVRKRLEEEYLPELVQQLERTPDRERAELLRRMRRALDAYRNDELGSRAV